MKDRAEFITNHPGQICCTAVQVVGCSDPFHYSLHYQNIRKQFGSSLSSCARMITVSGYFATAVALAWNMWETDANTTLRTALNSI